MSTGDPGLGTLVGVGAAVRDGRAMTRVLGVDVGERRIGLAISDPSRTLARPLATLTIMDAADGVRRVADEIGRLERDDDGLASVVVGLPVRLDGSPSDATARVAAFVQALKTLTALPILTTDERLTSREAESRLSVRERDWRRRKDKLDAAAAAIILQDHLDRSHG
jgi:putative Holliday junction resolvase